MFHTLPVEQFESGVFSLGMFFYNIQLLQWVKDYLGFLFLQ